MYMVLYNGTYDIFFGIEHRPRMEVCSRRSNIHSPTRMQAVMIASTRLVEFQWRLVMDGILVDTERKNRQVFFLDMKDDSLNLGYLSDED